MTSAYNWLDVGIPNNERDKLVADTIKAAKKALGPSPPCIYCHNESTRVILRPLRPKDIRSDKAFFKAIDQMKALPESFGDHQPALYICDAKECNKKANQRIGRKQ